MTPLGRLSFTTVLWPKLGPNLKPTSNQPSSNSQSPTSHPRPPNPSPTHSPPFKPGPLHSLSTGVCPEIGQHTKSAPVTLGVLESTSSQPGGRETETIGAGAALSLELLPLCSDGGPGRDKPGDHLADSSASAHSLANQCLENTREATCCAGAEVSRHRGWDEAALLRPPGAGCGPRPHTPNLETLSKNCPRSGEGE